MTFDESLLAQPRGTSSRAIDMLRRWLFWQIQMQTDVNAVTMILLDQRERNANAQEWRLSIIFERERDVRN